MPRDTAAFGEASHLFAFCRWFGCTDGRRAFCCTAYDPYRMQLYRLLALLVWLPALDSRGGPPPSISMYLSIYLEDPPSQGCYLGNWARRREGILWSDCTVKRSFLRGYAVMPGVDIVMPGVDIVMPLAINTTEE